MNRSDSSINPNVNKAPSEIQPSYVNHGYITEENPARSDPSYAETLYGNVGHRMEIANNNTSEKQIGQHDDLLYSNLERVNVAKELNGRMGSLNDSQNSLKKKPKPAPKPTSQTIQPSVICFDELLCKSSKFRNENYPGNAGSNKVDSTVESDFKKTDDYVTVNNADDYVAIKQEDKFVVMKACSKENNNLVYDNLPDDEKAKRHGDTGSKSDYTPMHSDDVYIYMNRRSVPNMGYVQMTGNIVAEDTYISMNEETANKRRSVPHVRRLRGKCDGVHLKGAEGCIFNSADYAYTYMLKPEVEKDDLSPFIKKKMKMDQMPCFCHEEKSDIFYSCEDLYHIVSKNVIYNSLSDVPANCNEANAEKPITQDPDLANRSINDEYDLADKEFEPFKKEPNASTSSAEQTKGVTATKRFSKVIRKKLEQAKQLMTDW